MSEDNFQEILKECGDAMMKDFVLNTYITGTLEGKTLQDLDINQLMGELREQWNEAMAELPGYIQSLQDGETLAARYKFAGQNRLLIGLNKVGPFMKIEPNFIIGYSSNVFENSAAVDELVENHGVFNGISKQMLGDSFDDIQGRTELEEGGQEFKEYLSGNRSGLVYQMKKGFAFALGNVFSHLMFKKSYGEVIAKAAMDNREQIRTYDALSRFFGGERDFVQAHLKNTGVSNEAGIKEIGTLATSLSHSYGRLRQEKVKKLKAYLLYAPAQF